MDQLVSKSPQRWSEMGVVVETQAKVSLIQIEVASINCKLLDSDGLVD